MTMWKVISNVFKKRRRSTQQELLLLLKLVCASVIHNLFHVTAWIKIARLGNLSLILAQHCLFSLNGIDLMYQLNT